MNTTKHGHGQSLDEFLNHSTRGGGGGGFLSGWKKEGSIVVYLHPQLWSAPFWNHGVPRVAELTDKETKDKRLVVMTDRWGCHESEALLKHQNFREKDGTREYPPQLCPVCKLIEAVREAYQSGTVEWTAPLFKWESDNEDDTLELLAGGIDNSFSAKEITREQLRELRAAGVNRSDSWKQNLKAKLNYLFCVVAEDDVESGVQKAFESKGLGEKLKKAIKDEIRKRKDRGNPVINPYPFEWTYDDSKQFDDKYDVLARSDDSPSAEILALLQGEPPNIERDVSAGNCFNLRAELEAHYVGPDGAIDFDEIFAAAEKAGLMEPPKETKDDADADDELDEDEEQEKPKGRTPEVRGSALADKKEPAKAATAKPEPAKAAAKPIEIGVTSDAWKKPEAWKAPANLKGATVHLNAPDDVSDEDVALVTKKCKAVGAKAVGLLVTCSHCDEVMTTLDSACPHCGSEYDDAGVLTSRPCLAEGCEAQVPLEGDGPKYICPKQGCSTLHVQGDEGDDGKRSWEMVAKEEPKAAEVPSRRRRGVPFDQPATVAAKKGAK